MTVGARLVEEKKTEGGRKGENEKTLGSLVLASANPSRNGAIPAHTHTRVDTNRYTHTSGTHTQVHTHRYTHTHTSVYPSRHSDIPAHTHTHAHAHTQTQTQTQTHCSQSIGKW